MKLASPLNILGVAISLTSLLSLCTAVPQATPTPIPMPVKYAAFRQYISTQPDTNVTHSFDIAGGGARFTQTYADGDCLQLRYYNRDCIRDIIYKTRGALKFLDQLGWTTSNDPWPNAVTYWNTGIYEYPDDGWEFYQTAWITFGKCAMTGPEDLCSITWCKDKEGHSGLYTDGFYVPKGANPVVDPNDKDNLCPWLKEGGPKC